MVQRARQVLSALQNQASKLLPFLPILVIAATALVFVLRQEAGLRLVAEELRGVRSEVASIRAEVAAVRNDVVRGLADQKVQAAERYATRQDLGDLARRVLELERTQVLAGVQR